MSEASRPIVETDETTATFPTELLVGAVGVALLLFLGWRWNQPLAAWFAPVFLIRSDQDDVFPFSRAIVALVGQPKRVLWNGMRRGSRDCSKELRDQ